jgi:hypothetical protein
MRNLFIGSIAFCILSTSASADESWLCNFSGASANQPNPVRYALHDRSLTEFGLGFTYSVLTNDETAIVAALGGITGT